MTPERIAELNRTTISIEYLNSIPNQVISEADEESQIRALEPIAIRFGLYDAKDFLHRRRGDAISPLRSHVVLPEAFKSVRQFPQVQSVFVDQLDALQLLAGKFGLKLAADWVEAIRRF